MFAGRAPSWNGGFLNYHLERREEVIKINLGRRSPEKVGGDEELRRVGQCCNSQSSRRRSGRGVQLQILSPGVGQ